MSSLELLGFEGDSKGIRPSLKHREKIRNWPIPESRAELDAFLWLTPFLRIFIPGRSQLVMIMKEAYMMQAPDEPKKKEPHDDSGEDCDEDFTKEARTKKRSKPTIRKKWVEKSGFDWGKPQLDAFNRIKEAISTNAMAGADPDLQYHLSADASQSGLGSSLFQLHGTKPGTEAIPKFQPSERIILSMSYRLLDAETRYSNSERECYAIVRSLAEVRRLVVGSRYPVMVYTDHEALKSLFNTGKTENGTLAAWMDRLGEYDLKLFHRPSRDQHIGIADGLSRMPTRFLSDSRKEDRERPAIAVPEAGVGPNNEPKPGIQRLSYPRRTIGTMNDRLSKYRESPLYLQLMEYMDEGQDRLGEMGMHRSRIKALKNQAKSFYLCPDTKLTYFIEILADEFASSKQRLIDFEGGTRRPWALCLITHS